MKKIYPRQLDLEVTSHCNLKCIGCPFNQPHNATHMDYGLYTSIIDRSVKEGFREQGVQYVLFLNGEPFLHPRYGEMVEQIIHHELRGYFTTNGSKWRDDVYDLVFSKENKDGKYIYQVIVSMDGLPWTNSHHLCKTGSNTQQVLGHIQKLLALKEKTGSKVDIAVKGVRRGQDWEEIENMIAYYLGVGVDYVCFADSCGIQTLPVFASTLANTPTTCSCRYAQIACLHAAPGTRMRRTIPTIPWAGVIKPLPFLSCTIIASGRNSEKDRDSGISHLLATPAAFPIQAQVWKEW